MGGVKDRHIFLLAAFEPMKDITWFVEHLFMAFKLDMVNNSWAAQARREILRPFSIKHDQALFLRPSQLHASAERRFADIGDHHISLFQVAEVKGMTSSGVVEAFLPDPCADGAHARIPCFSASVPIDS